MFQGKPIYKFIDADQELNPGDRVEGLGNFGKPTGQFGTIQQANEEDAIVEWDNAGCMRLRRPWLKKVWNSARPNVPIFSRCGAPIDCTAPFTRNQITSDDACYPTGIVEWLTSS